MNKKVLNTLVNLLQVGDEIRYIKDKNFQYISEINKIDSRYIYFEIFKIPYPEFILKNPIFSQFVELHKLSNKETVKVNKNRIKYDDNLKLYCYKRKFTFYYELFKKYTSRCRKLWIF